MSRMLSVLGLCFSFQGLLKDIEILDIEILEQEGVHKDGLTSLQSQVPTIRITVVANLLGLATLLNTPQKQI